MLLDKAVRTNCHFPKQVTHLLSRGRTRGGKSPIMMVHPPRAMSDFCRCLTRCAAMTRAGIWGCKSIVRLKSHDWDCTPGKRGAAGLRFILADAKLRARLVLRPSRNRPKNHDGQTCTPSIDSHPGPAPRLPLAPAARYRRLRRGLGSGKG